MADISGLNKLVALRQSAKISQKEAGALIGVDRKAFAKWESHQAIPERRHRLPLLQYLLETLGLADDPHTLKDLWESVAVALWEWDMLSKSERWFIERVQHSSQPSTDAPALPPYLYIPSLVGRSDFINTFKDALRPGRSLALIGIPGIGKSAIAITVANDQDIRNRYSDGVLWANLGKKPDLLGTLATWGVALGRDLSALATIEQRAHAIRNAIGNRSMLLIIDDAWDQHTAQQLQCGGPYSCHMLLTRVQSVAEAFATPQHVHRLSELDDAQGYELLQQLAPNAWDVDQESAKALARSVGGLPLALNVLGGYLAAPERRFFANTVRSKLTDLMDTQRRLQLALYRLGTTNDRAFTLQQVIELSLDNLPNIAVQTFFNLGAFASKPNWFDRQAAESVTLCNTDHLGLLIDRNLLEIGNFERLSIHQVLADFARTRTQRVMYERHRTYYHRLVRQDPDQWREIELFYPQLRWAWQCQRLYADHENRYNLLDVVRLYQHRRGLWQDYLEWSEETLEIARNENRPDIVASLLTSRAVVYDTLGDRTLALELHKQSLDLKIQIGDKRGEAIVLQNIASVFHQTGDRKSALDYYQRALGMMKQLEDASGMATILNNLGMLSTDLENIEDAFEYLSQALELRRRFGDLDGEAITLINFGNVYGMQNDLPKASEYIEQAIRIAQRVGNSLVEGNAYGSLGVAYYKAGEYRQAVTRLEKAVHLHRDIDNRPDEARALVILSNCFRLLGDRGNAFDCCHDALSLQREVLDRYAIMQSVGVIGFLHEDVENWELALQYFHEGLELASELFHPLDKATFLQKIGDVNYQIEQYEDALKYYLESLALVVEHGTLNQERGLRFNVAMACRQISLFDDTLDNMRRVIEIDRMLNHPDMTDDQDLLHKLETQSLNS